ncbi:AMIN-like domain-containing (lipo)protein [Saccharothrix syringae]|uniref:AMIN-like domain-containing protein n=1 Tax=Saccharothrix syringae TaxID=103733 RepID=A0A5Q0H910_SACSY|nr:hypothetical protein [Saccharothrix syringae]QFZ22701.1 hypothetical protein EKG83_39460 [Saccharothrix syringae]
MLNKLRRFGLLALTLVAVGAAIPAAAAGAQAPLVPVLTNVRTGQHAGFDRVVLDLNGPRPEFFIRCVDQLIADPSGNPVNLPGSYFLEVRSAPAAAHDDAGNPTYTGPRQFDTPGLANVQAFAITGDFEANLTVGLGLRRDSWHRVLLLDAPTRLVIDVGH